MALSIYQRAAYDHWPENVKEHGGVAGDGRFAALCCIFDHPSAKVTCLGTVCLADTAEDAQAMAARWCDAKAKGRCKGNHTVYEFNAEQWRPLRSAGS